MKLAYTAALAATALALAIPAAASAAPKIAGDWTASIGYSQTQVENNGPQLGAAGIRASFRSNMFWGVEGEIATGTHQDTVGGISYNLSSESSAYVTGTLPVGSNFDLFARAGYSKGAVRTLPRSNGNFEAYDYGVGAEWFLVDNKTGLRADYTRQNFLGGSGAANKYGVSVIRKF